MFMQERERDMQQDRDDNYGMINIRELTPSATKSEDIARQLIISVLDGHILPVDFIVKKKCLIEALEKAAEHEEVKKLTIAAIEQHGKEGARAYGASVKITQRTKYAYEKDPTWKKLKDEIADQEKAIKDQELRIKAACHNQASLVDPDTGELIASIVPHPATDTITVTFDKPQRDAS